MLALSLTLAGVPHAAPLTILFSTAVAFGYGLLADFSDLLFGFWGTAALILLPLFLALAWLLRSAARDIGQWLAAQLLLLGIVFPCLAGLDSSRAMLYLDLCGLLFLGYIAWLLVKRLEPSASSLPPATAASPVNS